MSGAASVVHTAARPAAKHAGAARSRTRSQGATNANGRRNMNHANAGTSAEHAEHARRRAPLCALVCPNCALTVGSLSAWRLFAGGLPRRGGASALVMAAAYERDRDRLLGSGAMGSVHLVRRKEDGERLRRTFGAQERGDREPKGPRDGAERDRKSLARSHSRTLCIGGL